MAIQQAHTETLETLPHLEAAENTEAETHLETGAAETHATEEHHSPVHISLAAEKLFSIGGFPVTNSVVMAVLSFVVLVGLAGALKRKISLIPGKLQSISEMILEALLGLMDSVLGSREKSEKYLPLIGTIFLFVVTSNWLGLLPGIGSLTFEGAHGKIPLLRPAAADLNFTLALGMLAILGVNLFGFIALGFRQHAGKFFNLNGMNSFIGILEFLSEFSKIISFSFRLFGNVFAGEVLLTIVAFLVPYIVPLPFMLLEIFVGFIQGFVFAMLALVFVGIAITGHDEHEETAHTAIH